MQFMFKITYVILEKYIIFNIDLLFILFCTQKIIIIGIYCSIRYIRLTYNLEVLSMKFYKLL
jgi:hypothetical protein